MYYLPVAGTWGREHAKQRSPNDPLDWFFRGSRFDQVMQDYGFFRVEQDRDPDTPDLGYWSGDIGGTLIQRIWPWSDHLEPWRKGGDVLRGFIDTNKNEFTDGLLIVTHSHGGHTLAMCLNRFFQITPFPIYVLDIDMPVQRGGHMSQLYGRAQYFTRKWTHLYSGRGWGSKFRWLGNRFGPRELSGATNVGPIDGGHSGILGGKKDYITQLPDILCEVTK